MSTPHRRRLKHFNDEGLPHFITFSCWNRLPLLSKDRSRIWFVDSLTNAAKKHDFGVWAYVIMPEHVHLLVIPHPRRYQMSTFLSSLKLGVSRPAIQFLREHDPGFLEKLLDFQPSGRSTYRFWQPGGGFDVNLRTDASVWEKIDYTHGNPQRRRLVERSEDWEWSSCRDYAAAATVGKVPIDWETLPVHPARAN